jgi:hypothetical protein
MLGLQVCGHPDKDVELLFGDVILQFKEEVWVGNRHLTGINLWNLRILQ